MKSFLHQYLVLLLVVSTSILFLAAAINPLYDFTRYMLHISFLIVFSTFLEVLFIYLKYLFQKGFNRNINDIIEPTKSAYNFMATPFIANIGHRSRRSGPSQREAINKMSRDPSRYPTYERMN